MLPVAILAGGLGTRLSPITDSLPKVLVPVAGKPFVLHQLDYLSRQGIKRVVLCIGHRAKQIEEVVGDGSACGLQVQYSRDGESLLGTGGAISKALSILGNDFFVLYGDSFLPVDLGSVQHAYHSSNKPGLMTVYRNAGRWDSSNVLFEDRKIIEYNKLSSRPEMQYIDCGLNVLSACIFDCKHVGKPFDLSTIFYQLSINGKLEGYEVFDRFYEIGSPEGLGETQQHFSMMRSN